MPGAGNVISGNGGDGVVIESEFVPRFRIFSHDNTVQGNLIGTDASGTAAIGNSGNGVVLREFTRDNVIGGADKAARNIISGNQLNGVEITGEDTTGNVVRGNWIGTDATGSADLGNTLAGVLISDGAKNNVVGGTSALDRNIISGNDEEGVSIKLFGTTGNTVLGNFIGTDKTGTLALPNVLSGVNVNATFGNIIGGTLPGSRNVISGNTEYGSRLDGSWGNALGTSSARPLARAAGQWARR